MRSIVAALAVVLLPVACTPASLPILEREAAAAYTQSAVTYTSATVDGKKCTLVAYTETENAAASTATVDVGMTHGTIRGLHADKTSGTAATLHPVIGRTSGWVVDDMNHVLTATATADPVYEQGKTHFYTPTSKLYVRSGVNAGSDNSISTELLVCAGWF